MAIDAMLETWPPDSVGCIAELFAEMHDGIIWNCHLTFCFPGMYCAMSNRFGARPNKAQKFHRSRGSKRGSKP